MGIWSTFWNWLNGTNNTADTQQGGSSAFSYVLIGAAVLLLIAVIFGELEDVA